MVLRKYRYPPQGQLSWESEKPPANRRRQRIPAAVDPVDRIAAIEASRSQTRDNERKEGDQMTQQTIALVTVAAELGEDPDDIAIRIGSRVFTDEASGLRVVDASTSRALIAERDAQLQRQAAQRAAVVAESNPTVERVLAIQRKQAAQREAGVIDRDTPALIAMAADDPDTRIESSGRRLDLWFAGGAEGYRFSPSQAQE